MSPIPGLERVGLLGGGVIGGGWAARFLLNGVDVLLFDPDDPRETAIARRISHRLVETALSMGGTSTGEHGIG